MNLKRSRALISVEKSSFVLLPSRLHVCLLHRNLAFVDRLEDFRKRQTEVIGASVDSKFTHAAWARVDRKDGGIKGVNYPLLSDINKQTAADYGVLIPDAGVALRGLFIINKAS